MLRMDLMFFAKKVIIVFDFQHPKENHLVSVLVCLRQRVTSGSLNLVITSQRTSTLLSTADEVDDHLPCLRSIWTHT